MPLQDDEIYYDGQIIGLVVADTLNAPWVPPNW